MVDTSTLKSARTVTDPDQVIAELTRANENTKTQVEFHQDDDGRVQIIKSIPGAIFTLPSDFSMPDAAGLKEMADGIKLPWQDEYADRALPWWASDERPDRHGDIVEQSWVFEDFATNPVLLDEHSWSLPPIGNVLNWQVLNRKDTGYEGPSLLLICLFATAEQSEFADSIFRLAKAKILRTGSVGFFPGQTVIVQDDDERADLGLGRYGYIYQNNNLIEFSTATVPANAGAFQLMSAACKSGQLKATDIICLRETQRRNMLRRGCDSQTWRTADMAHLLFWKALFPGVKLEPSPKVDEPINVIELFAEIERTEKRKSVKSKIAKTPALEESDSIESMLLADKSKKDDDEEPEMEDDDPDDVNVTDMLGAMTTMLTNVHDKLAAHSDTIDDMSSKLDETNESLGSLHDKVDSLGSTEDRKTSRSTRVDSDRTVLDIILGE